MQRTTILLRPITAETVVTESDLVSVNGYLAYSETIGGGVVNDLNVRDFLDNPSNEQIATDFFNFLQNNSTTEEFKAIFYNAQKLSNTFNDFYNKTIRTGQKPNRKDVTIALTGSTAHTFSSVDFVTSTDRSQKKTSVISFINTGHSYYVPVFIDIQFDRVETSDFDKYHQDCFGAEQIKRETEYKRFEKPETIFLPNPVNAVIENQSFVGAGVGRDGTTAFKFKFDKHVVKSRDIPGKIPVDIIFQNPVPSGQTIYMLISSSATTATFGIDFDLDNPALPDKLYKKFVLNVGATGITTNIRIDDSFKAKNSAKITLFLSTVVVGEPRGGNTTILMVPDARRFEVLNARPQIPVNTLKDVNEVKITHIKEKQTLLQCFVDENANDNESEFWRNNNVKVVTDRPSVSESAF
jgi:hypothetical protein